MNWKDTTSYSRGETDRQPTVWSATAGRFRIVITKGHIYYKGEWVMHLHPGVLDCYELHLSGDSHESVAMEKAQKIAEGVFRDALTEVTR